MRSTGVKDYDHEDSWCSKRCDNSNSFLNLDEIVGLRIQQPPKKQVAKKNEDKETTTMNGDLSPNAGKTEYKQGLSL